MKKIKSALQAFWAFVLRHKVPAVLVLIGLLVVVFVAVRAANRTDQALSSLQTAVIERGTLTATVGATGNARANQSAVLTWQTSGIVQSVEVEIGDRVAAGDELARLESSSLPQNLILAQADLVTAQRSLDNLLNSGTQGAQAQISLLTAQKAYNTARLNYNGRFGHDPDLTSVQAYEDFVAAQAEYNQAKATYDSLSGRAEDDSARMNAYDALGDARAARDRALTDEETLAKLMLAQSQLQDAQREWERLMDGPDANDILAAQARLDAAQAAVDMAAITAPFAGTVTDANPNPGDLVSPGLTAFRVDDLSRLLVEVQIPEVDINGLLVGQPVLVTFDAALGQEYHGKVAEVAQVGTNVQGAVNFSVMIELTDADEFVRPGMTAAVTITVKQLSDVLLVPNRAVRVVEGERVVFVQRSGAPEQVAITLGATSDLVSEVIDGGLQAGDVVILNPPATLYQTDGPPGFMGP